MVIFPNAFEDSSIQYLSIPHNLRLIGSQAFMNCQRLKKINYGQHLEDVQETAFDGCDNVEEIVLPQVSNKPAYILFAWTPTPEHPLTVHFIDKSVIYTERYIPPLGPGLQ